MNRRSFLTRLIQVVAGTAVGVPVLVAARPRPDIDRERIQRYLDELSKRKGLYAFDVVCDRTNNSAEDIEQGMLRADVYLKDISMPNSIPVDPNGMVTFEAKFDYSHWTKP